MLEPWDSWTACRHQVARIGTQLQGCFRIYSQTRIGGLTSRNSRIIAKGTKGTPQVTLGFTAVTNNYEPIIQSMDRHDSFWVACIMVLVAGPWSNKTVANSSGMKMFLGLFPGVFENPRDSVFKMCKL